MTEKVEEQIILSFTRTSAPPLVIRISGLISLRKPRQFCSLLEVEIPIRQPQSLHLDNIFSVYSDRVLSFLSRVPSRSNSNIWGFSIICSSKNDFSVVCYAASSLLNCLYICIQNVLNFCKFFFGVSKRQDLFFCGTGLDHSFNSVNALFSNAFFNALLPDGF